MFWTGKILRNAPNFEQYLQDQAKNYGGRGRLEAKGPKVRRRKTELKSSIVWYTYKLVLDGQEIGEYQVVDTTYGIATVSYKGTIPGQGKVSLGYHPISAVELLSLESPPWATTSNRYGREDIPFP